MRDGRIYFIDEPEDHPASIVRASLLTSLYRWRQVNSLRNFRVSNLHLPHDQNINYISVLLSLRWEDMKIGQEKHVLPSLQHYRIWGPIAHKCAQQ